MTTWCSTAYWLLTAARTAEITITPSKDLSLHNTRLHRQSVIPRYLFRSVYWISVNIPNLLHVFFVFFSSFLSLQFHDFIFLFNMYIWYVLTPLASVICQGRAFCGGYFILLLLQQLLCSTIQYGTLELTDCIYGLSVFGHHTVIAVNQCRPLHYA